MSSLLKRGDRNTGGAKVSEDRGILGHGGLVEMWGRVLRAVTHPTAFAVLAHAISIATKASMERDDMVRASPTVHGGV